MHDDMHVAALLGNEVDSSSYLIATTYNMHHSTFATHDTCMFIMHVYSCFNQECDRLDIRVQDICQVRLQASWMNRNL